MGCDWATDAWNSVKDFFVGGWDAVIGIFKDFADWVVGAAQYIWGDAKWFYYITKDLLLVAGPFLGFFLYSMLTREEVIITR